MGREVTIEHGSLFEHPVNTDTRSSALNYRVRLAGKVDGQLVCGRGDAPVRGRTTADDPEHSWEFATDALRSLHGARIPLESTTESQRALRKLLSLLHSAARERSTKPRLPFRGALLGLEVALLDLIATAHKTRIAALLGIHPSLCTAAPDVVSLDQAPEALVKSCQHVSGCVVRLGLTGDVDADLRALAAVATSSGGLDRRWWLTQPSETLSYESMERLLTGLADGAHRGALPHRHVLEHRTRPSQRGQVGALQRYADRLSAQQNHGDADFQIMAGGVSAKAHLNALEVAGGPRALNLNVVKVGGVLRTLEIATAAAKQYPSVVIALSGVVDAGMHTLRACWELARAVPADSYVLTDSFTENPYGPADGQSEPASDTEALIDDATRYFCWPAGAEPTLYGKRANSYPEEPLTRQLGKPAFRSHLVEREALAYGLATTRFNHDVFLATGTSGPPLLFGAAAHSPLSSAASFVISDHHKGSTYGLLTRAGLPVPEAQAFAASDTEAAIAYARSIGYPVVTKPSAGTGGTAVTLDINTDEELLAGFDAVAASRFAEGDVLVQRYVAGGVYRIVVLDDEVIAAVVREPTSVTGDGRQSIAEIIMRKNSYRRSNPHLRKAPIIGARAAAFLRSAGLHLDSVPRDGERVFLDDAPFLERGAESVDILDDLHPSLAEMAVRAVKTVPDLRFCGMDVVLRDHRLPLTEQVVGICELNAGPDLANPPFPLFGEPRSTAQRLLRASAEQLGVTLSPVPTIDLALHVTVTGDALGERYAEWLRRRASQLDVRGWARPSGEGTVQAFLFGPTPAVAALTSMAVTGNADARPQRVLTRHIPAERHTGFTVRLPASEG